MITDEEREQIIREARIEVGRRGGNARTAAMTPEARRASAQLAARARWAGAQKVPRPEQRINAHGKVEYELRPGVWVSRQRISQLKHPEKNDARIAVTAALQKGSLRKQPCAICGHPIAEAHHADYGKPLDITWLCKAHHVEAHRR